MSEKETKKRKSLFTVAMVVLAGLMFIAIFSFQVTYWIGLWTDTKPPTVYHLGTWAIPFYVGFGVFIVATLYSRDIPRGLLGASLIAAVLLFIGAVFNIFFTVYAWSLWTRCVTGVSSLDSAEAIQCSNNQWLIYIQAFWSFTYAVLAGLGFVAASIDAYLKFDAKRIVPKQVRDVASKAKQKFLGEDIERGYHNAALVRQGAIAPPPYPYQQ